MKFKIKNKIAMLEKQLIREAIILSKSFKTSDRNAVIKTALQIQTLKNILDN